MAHLCVYAVSALFLILVGIGGIESQECTQIEIDRCQEIDTHKCPDYKKMVSCLRNLQANCTDDQAITAIEYLERRDQRQREICPGLPEGTCYLIVSRLCMELVPLEFLHPDPQYSKQSCALFEGKSTAVKQCLNRLKEHCVGLFVLKFVDFHVQTVEHIEDKCEYGQR